MNSEENTVVEVLVKGVSSRMLEPLRRKAKHIWQYKICEDETQDYEIILTDVINIKIETGCVIITFKDLGYTYPVTIFNKDFESIVIM